MSKTKYIQFDDGKQAAVFPKAVLNGRTLNMEYLKLITSGMFEAPMIAGKEVILLKKG